MPSDAQKMKVIVCIKQVPDTACVRIDPATNTMIREGVASIINPFDMYALETALQLRDRYEARTVAMTMGPPQAADALREALSMGIGEAVHITDRAFAGSDTWATSLVLACGIRKIGDCDLVVCGKQAADGDTAQVGPGIASHLDLPQATYVRKISGLRLEGDARKIAVERLLEEGIERLELELPAVITVVKEIGEPRLPSLMGKMRARKQPVIVWNHDDLGLEENSVGLTGSLTRVVKIFTPPAKTGGKLLTGDPVDAVSELARVLKGLI
jgi:electron transfer flavoprotein beta subunit